MAITIEASLINQHSMASVNSFSATGIRPGSEKMATIQKFPEPHNQKQIPEFVSLVNYFRFLNQDFALYTGKLTSQFYKETTYTSEPLPEKAQSTFHHLQIALSSEPLVSHTRSDLNFSLTTDATMGDAASPGGMGAVLSQTGEDGVEHVESRPTS